MNLWYKLIFTGPTRCCQFHRKYMTSSTNKGRRGCELYIMLILVYFSDVIVILLNKCDVTLGRNKKA